MLDLDKMLGLYDSVLSGVMQRQRVTAHNIANQNTPGYRTKEVNFEGVLAAAVRRGDDLRGGIRFPVEETRGLVVKADGNNVNLEREWMLMEQSKLLHEVFARAAGGTFRGLVKAIRGR